MNKHPAATAGRKPDPRTDLALALREVGLEYSAIAERLFGGEISRAHEAVRIAKNRRAREAGEGERDERQPS